MTMTYTIFVTHHIKTNQLSHTILCLTSRTTMTSARIPDEGACHCARNLCVFSRGQKGTPGLTHKGCGLQRVSLDALSDVTIVLAMRQSIVQGGTFKLVLRTTANVWTLTMVISPVTSLLLWRIIRHIVNAVSYHKSSFTVHTHTGSAAQHRPHNKRGPGSGDVGAGLRQEGLRGGSRST